MNYCDACGSQSGDLVHVTVQVTLFSDRSQRVKIVQFWLCQECERNNRMLMENSINREGRIARALTPQPAWMVK